MCVVIAKWPILLLSEGQDHGLKLLSIKAVLTSVLVHLVVSVESFKNLLDVFLIKVRLEVEHEGHLRF